ncbi:hypothetical protein PtA15_4A861 [Puccinia triticina]|uniref:AB hydrolase-1 domain-containing protein n=1 Tax=Puccinia triticina TaxID=208348 RepID=A0ABY7CHL9_9BASI|nr:uncharacterized protein PtA15_4A861 [Puccinia triticina]WAQ84408.1 hypothetical protein PtA15_4A861 [Puccinia triticina]
MDTLGTVWAEYSARPRARWAATNGHEAGAGGLAALGLLVLAGYYLLGRARDRSRLELFIHARPPLLDHANQRDLRSVVQEQCPSLLGPRARFSPTPWLFRFSLLLLFSGCVVLTRPASSPAAICSLRPAEQTIYSAFGDFTRTDQVEYERRTIRVPDGGQIALDFTPPARFADPDDPTPTLVVLHGLTGGSHESYVRAVVAPLTQKHGWRAVVANFRGCAGSQLTSQKLYNAGATEDIRLVVGYLSASLSPLTRFHGVGFSLGANVLAKYLGEEGERALLRSAVVVGNPWDLYAGHCFLESSFLGRIYSRALASNLRAVMVRHLKLFQGRTSAIDVDALFANPGQSLYEFDSIVTRALGRFSSTEAYYKTQSSTLVVEAVRVPLLAINALDDPIVTPDAVPVESVLENPYLAVLVSKHGGHLGWFEGLWKPSRMIGRPIIEWLRAMDQAIQQPSSALPRRAGQTAEVEVLSVGKLGHPNASSPGTLQGL